MKILFKVIIVLIITILFSACTFGRFVIYNFADINDYKKFPAIEVKKGDETFKYAQGLDSLDQKIAGIKITNGKGLKFNFEDYLDKETKTVAFIVIRNDSVLFERYFEKYNESSIVTSFSVAKSFVSALVGIAVQEGFIKNVDEPVTNYIPELLVEDKGFEKITIEHVLNMRTGLKFNENTYTNPFSEIATLYYGKNHLQLLKNTKIEAASNSKHEYQSINTEILGIIVERATGKKLAKYFEEKLWQPLGMEYDASWNIDSKKHQNPKAFCCINARARDFAKFGSLYLKKGKWNGKTIINEDWIDKSVTPDFSNGAYQYQWYSVDKVFQDEGGTVYYGDSLSASQALPPDAVFSVNKSTKKPGKWYVSEAGPAFMAIGILGQYIYVDPAKNIVIVRFGKKGDSNYTYLFEAISKTL